VLVDVVRLRPRERRHEADGQRHASTLVPLDRRPFEA
jgi:hypothetical protein